MKKVVSLVLAVIMFVSVICIFTSCGNMSIGLGNFTFTKIHIMSRVEEKCIELEKWYEGSNGIEVKSKDGHSFFFSEGTYILVGDYCPICGK